MAAPPPSFQPVKAPAAPAPQKPFGAPAGSVDVRSHIPKKGTVDLSVHALFTLFSQYHLGIQSKNICLYILKNHWLWMN